MAVNKGKIAKPMISIQIVHYCCTNCSDEIEEMKLCPECKAPMKVVQVVEKYGSEAEEYLRDLLSKTSVSQIKTDADLDDIENETVENSILTGIDDDILEKSETSAKDDAECFEDFVNDSGIFADEENEEEELNNKNDPTKNKILTAKSKELTEILDELDKSDDDSAVDTDTMEELKEL